MTSPLIEAIARALAPWAWSDEPPEDYEPRQNGKTDAADIKDDWLAYVAVARAHSLAQAQAALKAISESGVTEEMVTAARQNIELQASQQGSHFYSGDRNTSITTSMNLDLTKVVQAAFSALPDTGGE